MEVEVWRSFVSFPLLEERCKGEHPVLTTPCSSTSLVPSYLTCPLPTLDDALARCDAHKIDDSAPNLDGLVDGLYIFDMFVIFVCYMGSKELREATSISVSADYCLSLRTSQQSVVSRCYCRVTCLDSKCVYLIRLCMRDGLIRSAFTSRCNPRSCFQIDDGLMA